MAEESLATLSENGRRTICTPILQAKVFYPAEDYHQKYYLRHQRELWGYFTSIYPNHADIVRSTAAARVNGLLRGYWSATRGTLENLLPARLHSIFVPA